MYKINPNIFILFFIPYAFLYRSSDNDESLACCYAHMWEGF